MLVMGTEFRNGPHKLLEFEVLSFHLGVYSSWLFQVQLNTEYLHSVPIYRACSAILFPYLASELWSNKFQRQNRCVEYKQTVSLPLTLFVCLENHTLLRNASTRASLPWSMWLSMRGARVHQLLHPPTDVAQHRPSMHSVAACHYEELRAATKFWCYR